MKETQNFYNSDIKSTKNSLTFWDHSVTFGAEFLGTAVLLFLSCAGCTLGVQKMDTNFLHISFASGLAVMVVIQIFGHISGAHVNPVVTLSALILNEISIPQAPIYILSQLTGCLAGSGLHRLLTPVEYTVNNNVTGRGVCITAPHNDLSDVEAFGIETVLTLILVFSICAAWDYRNSQKSDSVALRIGLVVASLNVSAAAYTGASMNPARSFGPAVWTGDYTAHWVYWMGPIVGSLIATCLYKFIFLRNQR